MSHSRKNVDEPLPPDVKRLLAAIDEEVNKQNDKLSDEVRQLDRSEYVKDEQSQRRELEHQTGEVTPHYGHNSSLAIARSSRLAGPPPRAPTTPAPSTPAFALSPPLQTDSRRAEMMDVRSSPLLRHGQSQSLNQAPVYGSHLYDNNNNNNEDVDEPMMDESPSSGPRAAAPIDLTLSRSPDLLPEPRPPTPPPSASPAAENQEIRQDLLRLRRLEIALRDANNFPSDTKIIDWPRLKQLPQPLQTKNVVRCFVRCRYVVMRSWARLSVSKNQTLLSMIRSQQGCTFFVQMTQFFRQLSRLVASQRYLSQAQLAELYMQHLRAASFFEEDFLQPSDNLPLRTIGETQDSDDNEASRRILSGPQFHAAVVVAEACSQPGAVRPEAQADWDLAEQLQGPVASAVNAAFAEIKTWFDWHLRVAPGDLTRVLKDEHALPRFAEWVSLLAARERLAFNRRPVPNYVSELINMRTAQARQWLQEYHNDR